MGRREKVRQRRGREGNRRRRKEGKRKRKERRNVEDGEGKGVRKPAGMVLETLNRKTKLTVPFLSVTILLKLPVFSVYLSAKSC